MGFLEPIQLLIIKKNLPSPPIYITSQNYLLKSEIFDFSPIFLW